MLVLKIPHLTKQLRWGSHGEYSLDTCHGLLYLHKDHKCSEGCSASGPHTKYLLLLLSSFNIIRTSIPEEVASPSLQRTNSPHWAYKWPFPLAFCALVKGLSPPTRGSRVSWWVLCKVCLFTQLCPTLATPWAVAHQAPMSMGFPGQEYWSGLPFYPPGDLLHPGIKPATPTLAGRIFTTWATREVQDVSLPWGYLTALAAEPSQYVLNHSGTSMSLANLTAIMSKLQGKIPAV